MMPLHQISVTPVDRAKSIEDKVMRHDTQETFHVTSPTPPSATERCSSRASTLSYSRDFCRICHCEGDSEVPLISPCYCAGSLRYVHQACLQQWIKSSDIRCCELCKFTFVMQSRTKPFGMWERLDMASSERRKLLCSVTFHVLAVTCVVWSLYVLIERTTEEVRAGVLGWPFWTKLIVVAIGVTGGIVFMYVQCKVYAQLFRRWRAYNRVIFVQNVPEKADLERPGAGSTGAPPGDRQPAHDGDQPVHVTIERPVLPPIAPAHAAAPLLPPTAPAAHSPREEDASPPTSPAAVTSPTGATSPVLVATLTGEEWVTPAEAVHLSAAV